MRLMEVAMEHRLHSLVRMEIQISFLPLEAIRVQSKAQYQYFHQEIMQIQADVFGIKHGSRHWTAAPVQYYTT